jgi:hypothetical protein
MTAMGAQSALFAFVLNRGNIVAALERLGIAVCHWAICPALPHHQHGKIDSSCHCQPSFRNEDRFKERQKFEENLAKLRELALAELERQGYDVRGKTPPQPVLRW